MSLFNKEKRERNDATCNDPLLYAITVHPCPTAPLNKKLYKNYNHDQQRAMLGRIEACIRRKNPSIELIEIHYEIAPITGQIHFHAMYSMPSIFQSTLVSYYRRIMDTTNDQTKVPWRYLDLSVIKDKDAWTTYIQKDSVKQ